MSQAVGLELKLKNYGKKKLFWTLKWRGCFADGTAQKQQQTWESNNTVRYSSYWDGSPQDELGVVQTCGMILTSAYMLCCLFATWSQL